ncbi:MAG: oxidoreductase, partial [Thermoleophilaceae bacterium]
MSTVINPAKAASQELSGLRGELIAPDDASFGEASKVYNAMIDKRPALIARCKRPDDVAKVVAFARDHDLLLAVRGGGHNGAGL